MWNIKRNQSIIHLPEVVRCVLPRCQIQRIISNSLSLVHHGRSSSSSTTQSLINRSISLEAPAQANHHWVFQLKKEHIAFIHGEIYFIYFKMFSADIMTKFLLCPYCNKMLVSKNHSVKNFGNLNAIPTWQQNCNRLPCMHIQISADIIGNGGYQWERAKEKSRAQLWPAAWSWRGKICYWCWFWALCPWPNTSAITTLFKNVFNLHFVKSLCSDLPPSASHSKDWKPGQAVQGLEDRLSSGDHQRGTMQCFRSVILIVFVILDRGGLKLWMLYIQRTTLSQRLRTSTDWKA